MIKGKNKESGIDFVEKTLRALVASAKTDKQKLLALREYTQFLKATNKIRGVEKDEKNFFDKG